MECLHPYCPMGSGAESWLQVVEDQRLRVKPSHQEQLIDNLNSIGPNFGVPRPIPTKNSALLKRLFQLCPCLFTQLEKKVTAEGIVHLCEIALEKRIDSQNVREAFKIQHPNHGDCGFINAPLVLKTKNTEKTDVGPITESLCSEVLGNEGIPHVELDNEDWPV